MAGSHFGMRRTRNDRRGLLDQPETTILIFAFLLNYPWEFLQAPFYEGLAHAAHWQAVKVCTRAAGGDAVIMLAAYASVAAVAADRWWLRAPSQRRMIGFLAIGILVTIVIEILATRSDYSAWGWQYSGLMPLLPGLDVGLTPILQWILLPPLTIWFARRQLGAASASAHPDAAEP